MQDFIERLRAKPEHVRKQIAMGTAAGLTGIVALGWLGGLVAGGTLALAPAGDDATVATDSKQNGFEELLGAAGAAVGATSTPNELNVVETKTTSTLDNRMNQQADTRTVIPF